MPVYSLGVVESRFADIIWENAPLSSGLLVKMAESALSWKRSTTYTVLKRLCEKGLFQHQNGTVTVLISKEQFYAQESEKFVEETFHGSLPAFLAAFTSRKTLTKEEIAELQSMIESIGREP